MWQRIFIAGVTFLLVACQSSQPSPTAAPATPPSSPAATSAARPTPMTASLPTAAPTLTATRAGDLLYLDESYGPGPGRLAIVDAATGEQLRSFPRGVPAPDWSTLYLAECRDGTTTVSAIAVASGKTVRVRSLDGCFALPPAGTVGLAGLSPRGNWLALAEVSAQSPAATAAAGYSGQSRFVVLDTTLDQPPRFVDVQGRFSFDAIDNGGTSLYLIEDLPPTTSTLVGTRYQVRLYNLTTKSLEPGAIADKSNTEPIMAGLRQTSVASADGQWLYSLYLNNETGPFIHALNLDNHFALCLDLPAANKADVEKQMLWTLAMSPDGWKLYAANGALGLVAQLDPANGVIQRTADLKLAAVPTPAPRARALPAFASTAEARRLLVGGAAVTSDGKTLLLIGENGLLSVGTGDLQLHGRALPDLGLRSIAASPDGAVFVVPDEPTGRLLQIDALSGAILSAKSVGNLWGILGVEPGSSSH